MRFHHGIVVGAWALSGITGLVSLRAWSTAVPPVPRQASVRYEVPPEPPPVDSTGVDASANTLRSHDVFRLDRKPTSVRYNPAEPQQLVGTGPATRPGRPPLILVGLVGGPNWQALVEGIPGSMGGVILTVGRGVNRIRLDSVRRDSVFLAGLDTTWVLTHRQPWH